ncbi:UNVERIFIED_CONTAM: hypothetical protein FKN15_029339 [Acipenser sinensis]
MEIYERRKYTSYKAIGEARSPAVPDPLKVPERPLKALALQQGHQVVVRERRRPYVGGANAMSVVRRDVEPVDPALRHPPLPHSGVGDRRGVWMLSMPNVDQREPSGQLPQSCRRERVGFSPHPVLGLEGAVE